MIGKKGKKRGEKECEPGEPSGGLGKGKGKGRYLFPFQVARLARGFFFFTLSILFFTFYPTKEPGPRLGEELNRQEIEATYAAAKKNPERKIQAYTGFKYFTYAVRVLQQ